MVTTSHDYERLLKQFVTGDIDATEFERRYWEIYNRHDYEGTREEDDILMGYLSAEVDAFCADPSLRPKVFQAIDEAQLKEAAMKALTMLERLRLRPPQARWTNRLAKYSRKLLHRTDEPK